GRPREPAGDRVVGPGELDAALPRPPLPVQLGDRPRADAEPVQDDRDQAVRLAVHHVAGGDPPALRAVVHVVGVLDRDLLEDLDDSGCVDLAHSFFSFPSTRRAIRTAYW